MAKILKVEIISQHDDGMMVIKMIEGEMAEKWQKFCANLATIGEIHHMNPPWEEIIWQEREMS